MEDGLSDNRVGGVALDSRGLLWICTSGGLTRFDGAQFQSFAEAEGLPLASINDVLEMSTGDLWLASNGVGVIRFPGVSRKRPYESFPVSSAPTTNRVNRLFRAADGTIWAGTDGGLFRMTIGADNRPAFSRFALRLRHPEEIVQVWYFVGDPDGSVWVGTRFGVVRILRDDRIIHYRIRQDLPTDNVLSLVFTPEDRLVWMGHETGLALFKSPPASSYGPDQGRQEAFEDDAIARAAVAGQRRVLDTSAVVPRSPGDALYFVASGPDGSRANVSVLRRSEAGTVDVVAKAGIFEFSSGRVRQVLVDPRLQSSLLNTPGEDAGGNLWVPTTGAGIFRIARNGFTTFRASDGLGGIVSDVFGDRTGDAMVVSENWRVSRFDGSAFHTVHANVPAVVQRAGWRPNEHALQDHAGDWWFATRVGLLRFSGIRKIDDLATAVPRLYTKGDGLAQDDVTRLYEDSRGDVWIASLIPGREVLTRWNRASGQFQRFSDADGLRAFNAPEAFYDDPHGVLWISFREGGMAQYSDGRFHMLNGSHGLPPTPVRSVAADRAGRLWWTTRDGLFRLDDLNEMPLRPTLVVTSQQLHGIASKVVEDAFGSIYAVTPKSVLRVSSAGRGAMPRITATYTTGDGLVAGEAVGVYADRQGRLWFATTQGISYYLPAADPSTRPPVVRIGGLRVAGAEQPVAPGGEDSVSGLELYPGRSQLQIDVFGITFATGDALAFEHRLVGADEEWSAPSPLRSLLFSNLAPGRYEFQVRAVSSSGTRSPQPARVTFRVVPPVWQRWWFITLAALAALAGAAMVERYRAAHRREISRVREARLAELEQVRRRIAADLHDEIGSSLTQISILSEVARRQGADAVPQLSHPLTMIASSSRELVDAMSDIVWAINPAKDHLADLTQRMRRFAADAFTASNVRFQLQLPPPEREITLGANVRREVFLIFKEVVNNIVKHAQCTEATIAVAVDAAVLRLDVHDNGIGFDPDAPSEGHGLASLRHRASALGGSLALVSAPGGGTDVTLILPIPT